jgi:hypothetical protein
MLTFVCFSGYLQPGGLLPLTAAVLASCLQGDDAVHDAIRLRELEAAVPRRVVAALRQHGSSSDDVLWAALFVLAVLVRDNSCIFDRAKMALAWAGVLRVRSGLFFVFAGLSNCCCCCCILISFGHNAELSWLWALQRGVGIS